MELVPSKWGLVTDRLLVLSRRFSDILTKVQEFVWRLLELHIAKVVALFSVWVALQEVKCTASHLLLFFGFGGPERGSGVFYFSSRMDEQSQVLDAGKGSQTDCTACVLLKEQVQRSSLVKIKTKVGGFRKTSQG